MIDRPAVMTAIPFAFALAAGAVVPFQAASNAALGRTLGNPLWAAMASLLTSLIVIVATVLAMKTPLPALGAAGHRPPWLWLGGIAGAVYIAGAVILPPKLGAGGFIVGVIAGQMLASTLIDHFGLMGLEPKPMTLARITGVGLIAIGILVVQSTGKASSAPLPDATADSRGNDR
ncbi:DMT family transporter [Burkholderia sp. Bp9140]|uniref:DMT family transporter n=1 Tax=Burkholderia sp. Bp9140 TaxID=2184572 RepID=UPI000F560C82|nr:DMT family transporter [Burkholderia sp. Bp9140]RQR54580.1 DMT family transporter [Burkholderia sp. Bp9140]